jgi:AcrR family transcriptional regulator
MKTRIRRDREFEKREEEFLTLARRMISEDGLAGFTMDRLAASTEYSKGTIYQHFASKEDVVCALGVQSIKRRVAWFERAVGFRGGSREKIYAITAAEEIFVTLQPLHFRSEMMIKFSDFRERASPERISELGRLEQCCSDSIWGLVEEAVRVGDLVLPSQRSVGAVVTGLISIHIGAFLVMFNFPEIIRFSGLTDPLRALRDHLAVYLDGLNWRPLSTQLDPLIAFRRIFLEVFPNESREAGLAGA